MFAYNSNDLECSLIIFDAYIQFPKSFPTFIGLDLGSSKLGIYFVQLISTRLQARAEADFASLLLCSSTFMAFRLDSPTRNVSRSLPKSV